MDAAVGRNPVSKRQTEYGDELADTGRDCRTRLARPNSQARTLIGKYYFSCLTDHVQDWKPYPVDSYTLAICVAIHTYIHALETSHVGTNMAHRVLNSSPQKNAHLLTKPRHAGPQGEIE